MNRALAKKVTNERESGWREVDQQISREPSLLNPTKATDLSSQTVSRELDCALAFLFLFQFIVHFSFFARNGFRKGVRSTCVNNNELRRGLNFGFSPLDGGNFEKTNLHLVYVDVFFELLVSQRVLLVCVGTPVTRYPCGSELCWVNRLLECVYGYTHAPLGTYPRNPLLAWNVALA